MFSAITIASSTKIPITIIIPKVDKTLIVSPKIGANINIPKKETGRPKATQKAILEFKKIERNNLLQETDWTLGPDSPLTDAQKTEVTEYRDKLRNFPATADFPNGALPTKPDFL